MRILAGTMALLVAGCSLGDQVLPPMGDEVAGPRPPYRKLIAVGLPGIIGDPKRAQKLQISEPRRVDSVKGPAWLICLRATVDARSLDHAVFIQNEKIIESRVAIRADRCEEQPFGPFSASAAS